MRVLRNFASTAVLLGLLFGLGLTSLLWNLLAVLLYPLLGERVGKQLGRQAISGIYQGFWSAAAASGLLVLESGVLDRLRDEPGLIIVANHPSMLDALILVARLPRSACIMKADLMRNIFLGTGARLARYIRNDSARGMVRLAVQDLKDGGQLVIFPEGTRTTRWPVNPFGSAAPLIAKLAGAPIQTVFIDTASPYLGKGWPIWRLPPLPIVFKVRLGDRFSPQPDAHDLQRRLELYFAAGVRAPAAAASAAGAEHSEARSA